MEVTYEKIAEVNKELSSIDIKGKDYVVVPQRVKAFRMVYPTGFILTDILSHENGVVVMQAKAGYYKENGDPVTLGTGLAFEKADSSYINKTSYIENCETSAVGRVLGFLGFGIDASICSAEELINAVNNQNKQSNNAAPPVRNPQKGPENGTVEKSDTLPVTPGMYLMKTIAEMAKEFNGFNFNATRKALIESGTVPDIPSATMTMDQAVQLMEAVRAVYEMKVS